jgi:RNA polymerase sigma factor (sigma-70 family)|nr:sigma-70 family RNA polymerase sigma factor [Kofleriaceae bacterium]
MPALVPSDADLAAAARAGDRDAFGAIVARHQRAVVAVVYAMTCDRVLGDDIAQEVFVIAWTQLARLHDDARLAAWLCGIARKRALHTLRWRRREVALEAALGEPIAATSPAPPTPFDQLADHEREQIAARALARVPDTYRDALVLYYCDERSASAVARALGITVDAANQRLSRGRACLAEDAAVVVERQLAAKRPRRDLVAGVLAAIAGMRVATTATAAGAAAGGGAAAASIVARVAGWKLGLVGAAAVLVVAGIGVASAAHASVDVAAPDHAATPATPASLPAAAATPAPALPAAIAPEPEPDDPVAAADGPTCDELARHVTDLVAAGEAADAYHALRSPDWRGADGRQIADSCDAWPPATRACVASASSLYDLLWGCPGLETEPGLRPSLGRHVAPEESGDDLGCAHVAAHVASLYELDPARFATVPPAHRDRARAVYDEMRRDEPDRTRRACESEAWDETRRRCFLLTRADYLLDCL